MLWREIFHMTPLPSYPGESVSLGSHSHTPIRYRDRIYVLDTYSESRHRRVLQEQDKVVDKYQECGCINSRSINPIFLSSTVRYYKIDFIWQPGTPTDTSNHEWHQSVKL